MNAWWLPTLAVIEILEPAVYHGLFQKSKDIFVIIGTFLALRRRDQAVRIAPTIQSAIAGASVQTVLASVEAVRVPSKAVPHRVEALPGARGRRVGIGHFRAWIRRIRPRWRCIRRTLRRTRRKCHPRPVDATAGLLNTRLSASKVAVATLKTRLSHFRARDRFVEKPGVAVFVALAPGAAVIVPGGLVVAIVIVITTARDGDRKSK
ncbi:MAG: hypothetical protein M5R36_04165 [Deltaproteobacteria bacterium]|nr:hypothetical protein [Deltaproteobacteria bacterium]